uniref:Sas10 domain-containing protein n=1 Tax=Strongyloides stercoralis TaxID=6248 RepID=A0A0K0DT52_STRER
MAPKRQKKLLGKSQNKKEMDTVVHLSGDEDEDEIKLVKRTEYKDRIPENLELDLMESRTTAENLSKNIMIFSDYDSDKSEDEESSVKSKQTLSMGKDNEESSPERILLKKDINNKVESDKHSIISLDEISNVKTNTSEYIEMINYIDNIEPVFNHFLEKFPPTSQLFKIFFHTYRLCMYVRSLSSFEIFRIYNNMSTIIEDKDKKTIKFVRNFMDIVCDHFPEIEEIITLLEDKEGNEDVLKDMYETLISADCQKIVNILENWNEDYQENVSKISDSEDDQLITDSEDDEYDKNLLQELRDEQSDKVTETHVERRLDQAIIDNKGYTPTSKKKKKTPGVKRRHQFQKASLRNRSNGPGVRREIPAQDGEARGIKINVVKSRKF